MPLSPRTRLGPYEIAALIGVGGMGEVYRATDTNLKRQVAIKVLPEALASDAERLARFQREAEVLAALNHPNIAAIYGLERADGRTALVMELVEGDTLAERLALEGSGLKAQGSGGIRAEGSGLKAQGSGLPVAEALAIAKQIAEALEAAHEQGIVHRDLKPANVKVRPDGTVKVLDFGLAKMTEVVGSGQYAVGSQPQSLSPTITTPAMTQAGMILGTAAYMSPEQAKGKPADRRSDVWAFGAVLFEMLTGKRAFAGESVSETLADVMRVEPAWHELPDTLSPLLKTLLQRCLSKDPKRRLPDIGAMRLALDGAFGTVTEPERPPSAPRSILPALAAAVAATAIIVGAVAWVIRPEPPAPVVSRFRLDMPSGVNLASINGSEVAISPDGTRIAFLGQRTPGELQVYVRDLDEVEARVIPGSEVQPMGSGLAPFFSADGASIGFRTAEGLMRASLAGSPPVRLVGGLTGFFNAVWEADGRILYSAGGAGVFHLWADGSRPPERLTPEPEPGVFYVFPSPLPTGHVLVSEWRGTPIVETVVLLDPATSEMRTLVESARNPVFTSTGHLVFQRGATLMAVPFDLGALTVQGDPMPVVQGVTEGGWALSNNGTLIYVPEPAVDMVTLEWMDRDGKVLGPAVTESFAGQVTFRISPEGERIAVTSGRFNQPEGTLSVYDLAGRPPIPLLQGVPSVSNPVWSPDGTRVAFMSGSPGRLFVYTLAADGSSQSPERVETGADISVPTEWVDDDELLVNIAPAGGIFGGGPRIVSATGGPLPTNPATGDETGSFERRSPDGRWLAYQSNRSGSMEIWVRAFPDGARVRVSPGGGIQPRWSRDGRTLFYRQANTIMAVAVTTSGDRFSFGVPTALFEVEGESFAFDVAPDGRFLVGRSILPDGAVAAREPGVIVVQNWTQELQRLVPTR